MFCKKCGNEIDPNSLFCNKCGEKVTFEDTNTNKGKSFLGRISVRSAWRIIAYQFILTIILGLCISSGLNKNTLVIFLTYGVFFLCLVNIIRLLTTVLVQRLHDLNLSGFYWWALLGLHFFMQYFLANNCFDQKISMFSNEVEKINSIIDLVVLLVIYTIPGTKGPNKYGDEPK